MEYQICANCVLDTSVTNLYLDQNGICQYCNEYDQYIARVNSFHDPLTLQALLNKIKENGKNKEYDCIIGLSGGVDSSYVAYLLKEKYNLRPLAIHLDNGWNDELAVMNIENVCKILNIDLITHVIEWEEFKDLQLSFLKASLANAEAPTDHAIFAILYKMAAKYNIKWVIDGGNYQTEYSRKGFKTSGYTYVDLYHIKAVHKIFGQIKLSSFPQLSYLKKLYYRKIKGIKQIGILNYIDYNKEEAKTTLQQKLNWTNYGSKHHESLFTKWHQCVNLIKKFSFDKRRIHLSDLILSKQLSRDEAIEILLQPPLNEIKTKELEEYVTKKLEFSETEYDNLLNSKPISYKKYPNQEWLINLYHNWFGI